MSTETPPFMLYVVWHPNYEHGKTLGNSLFHHFRSDRLNNITSGADVDVLFRYEAVPGASTPLPIEWDAAHTVAVVVLINNSLVADEDWTNYVTGLIDEAVSRKLNTLVFPVAIAEDAIHLELRGTQAIHWYDWSGDDENRGKRLIRELTYQFVRMLRHHLGQTQGKGRSGDNLHDYLEKVSVFLSHSKKDGVEIAEKIRDWVHSNALSSFFDFYDIPPGVPFSDVIYDAIPRSAVLPIYTNTFSSREWCCREVLYAKRKDVPILVVDCLTSVDERAFPYLGNVPVVRIEPSRPDIGSVIGKLLDVIFKYYLWQCRVEALRDCYPHAFYFFHHPELLDLTKLPPPSQDGERALVYPEPAVSSDEKCLFSAIAGDVELYSLRQWIAKEGTP